MEEDGLLSRMCEISGLLVFECDNKEVGEESPYLLKVDIINFKFKY